MCVCVCVCVRTWIGCVHMLYLDHSSLQHASSDVERLLIGNKCDLESKRVIPYNRGVQVSSASCDPTSYHDTNVDSRGTQHKLY